MGYSDQKTIRPVFVVSAETLENYSDLLRHLFAGLIAEGCSCCVVTPPGHSDQLLANIPINAVEYPYMDTRLLTKFNQNRLLAYLEDFKPSLVHCFSISKMNLSEMISQRLNIPTVYSFFRKPHKFLSCHKISSENCAKILVSNDDLKDRIAKQYPEMSDRIIKFRFGTYVDSSVACYADESHVPSFVVSHPINRIYEFEPLLNAVRHLGIDGYEFVLAIIGTGREETHLRRLVHSLGLSHNVSVVGEMKPIRKFISGADIYIQPNWHEEFAADLFEAMGAGLAIACPKVDDEFLSDNENALFFEPGDEYSIYQVLKKLLDKHELAKKIARNSQSIISQNCSVSKMISEAIDVYSEVVEREM